MICLVYGSPLVSPGKKLNRIQRTIDNLLIAVDIYHDQKRSLLTAEET